MTEVYRDEVAGIHFTGREVDYRGNETPLVRVQTKGGDSGLPNEVLFCRLPEGVQTGVIPASETVFVRTVAPTSEGTVTICVVEVK